MCNFISADKRRPGFQPDCLPEKMDGSSCFTLHLERAEIADGGVIDGHCRSPHLGNDITCGFLPCCIMPVRTSSV